MSHTRKRRRNRKFTRRSLLKAGGAFTALGLTNVFLSCGPISMDDDDFGGIVGRSLAVTEKFSHAPYTPRVAPDRDRIYTFSLHEARTVDALAATIFPGTPEDPGAREAGVVSYIDHLLSIDQGIVEPTYLSPPFASAYEGDSPPEEAEESGYDLVWIPQDEIERYGPQTGLVPAAAYRSGIRSLDAYAQREMDADFVDLDEDEQQSIVADIANGDADTFETPSAQSFFAMVRQHTIEGMFCDPVYGGNRDMVGWKLIGYPGAQRAYTPVDMATEAWALDHEPQSILQLHEFNPGDDVDEDVILPVQQSEEISRMLLEELCGPGGSGLSNEERVD